MVLPAASALLLANTAVIYNNDTDLQQEVNFAETKIRSATTVGVYLITHNASIVGNPGIDPRAFTAHLPPLQQNFYNAFTGAGYSVGLDILTGYWLITWAASGPEAFVMVYSFRTIINPTTPTDIVTRTITTIQTFFNGITPVIHTEASYNGFIDETAFGGSSSTFYEFTIIASNESDRTDYSSALLTYLTTQGMGYTTGNARVYLLTP